MRYILIIFIFFTFSSFSQNEFIPMWVEITPDSVYLTEDLDSVMIFTVCQDLIGTNYKVYKGLTIFALTEKTIDSSEYHRIYGDKCDSLFYPKDLLLKYQLTENGVLNNDLCNFEIKKKLIDKTEINEPNPLWKYQYTIQTSISIDNEIVSTITTKNSSNVHWKKIKPISIKQWKLSNSSHVLIMVRIKESYINDEKIYCTETKLKPLIIKCP